MICGDPEGGMGGGGGCGEEGEEAQGILCTHVAVSLYCTAETNTTW